MSIYRDLIEQTGPYRELHIQKNKQAREIQHLWYDIKYLREMLRLSEKESTRWHDLATQYEKEIASLKHMLDRYEEELNLLRKV